MCVASDVLRARARAFVCVIEGGKNGEDSARARRLGWTPTEEGEEAEAEREIIYESERT